MSRPATEAFALFVIGHLTLYVRRPPLPLFSAISFSNIGASSLFPPALRRTVPAFYLSVRRHPCSPILYFAFSRRDFTFLPPRELFLLLSQPFFFWSPAPPPLKPPQFPSYSPMSADSASFSFFFFFNLSFLLARPPPPFVTLPDHFFPFPLVTRAFSLTYHPYLPPPVVQPHGQHALPSSSMSFNPHRRAAFFRSKPVFLDLARVLSATPNKPLPPPFF